MEAGKRGDAGRCGDAPTHTHARPHTPTHRQILINIVSDTFASILCAPLPWAQLSKTSRFLSNTRIHPHAHTPKMKKSTQNPLHSSAGPPSVSALYSSSPIITPATPSILSRSKREERRAAYSVSWSRCIPWCIHKGPGHKRGSVAQTPSILLLLPPATFSFSLLLLLPPLFFSSFYSAVLSLFLSPPLALAQWLSPSLVLSVSSAVS